MNLWLDDEKGRSHRESLENKNDKKATRKMAAMQQSVTYFCFEGSQCQSCDSMKLASNLKMSCHPAIEERRKESRRVSDAIDTHTGTHDISTQVLFELWITVD